MVIADNSRESASPGKRPARRLQLPKKHWYNPLSWRRRVPLPPRRPVPSTIGLLKQSNLLLRKGWRPFVGITLIYGIGILIFVRSFSVSASSSTTSIADASGLGGKLSASLSQLSSFASSATASLSAASSVYQIIISTICCLAIIWAVRELLSGNKITTKKSFYRGMQPLTPYTLVLVMIGVYLIPVALAGYLYSLILGLGILSGFPAFVAFMMFLVFAVWSVSMLVHGMFALFIVTLPDMMPMRAIKSAKKLVFRRRLLIIRKIIIAFLIALIIGSLIMLPFILWLPVVAPWVFFLLTVVVMTYGEVFLYVLYRELL